MTDARRAALLPILALTAASILWASAFIAFKLAFQAYDTMFVVFARMLVACVCFAPLYPRFRSQPYRAGDWKPIALMGLCEPGLYFLFETAAIKNTEAAQAGMIVAMLPLLVAVGAHFILKEKVSLRTWGGFLVAVIGAALLSCLSTATESAPNPALGNFQEFLAMICAMGYTILLKQLSRRYSPMFLTFTQAVFGCLFFLPLMFLPGQSLPTEFVLIPALSIVYLGAASTMGAYGLYSYGVSKIPASQASAFVNLIPVATIIMARLVLGEVFSLGQYLASALVLGGVILSQDRKRAEE
ncbi:MAG TPA: DMT family transporter [Humidesulfovibrio sp.]|uniref:DMT family transporter n=1 Tax=Humidesulfovibrio sp. TaxID=2910988 RepID=UPI002B76830A|nr:DMT family transporter [Humidesulfovibrio sp.]HWR02881.1 DMT family transporter [Humidesulfovibrio sp.]